MLSVSSGSSPWQGGQISRRQAIFSADGRLVLSPCGAAVAVFSAATGERTAYLGEHSAVVTCIALNPSDPGQLYSGSRDGSLRLWDIEQEACLRVFSVNEAVRSLVIHDTLRIAYLAIEWREGHAGRVICMNLDTGRPGSTAMKTRSPGPLVMNPRGSLVATIDRHSLMVWRAAPEISQPLNLHHTRPYTCLALSADDSILAAGDVSGRVLIWRDFGMTVPTEARQGPHSGKHQPQVPLPTTTLHWHASPVGCLSFSPDNVFLFSGGAEAVLVIWQLDGGRPSFLPRLGAPLGGIVTCPSDAALVLVRQTDNTLRIVNTATMKIETSIIGIKPAPGLPGSSASLTPCALHPTTGLLALPTSQAQMQLYDILHHRHAALVQVSARNPVQSAHGKEGGPGGVDPNMHLSLGAGLEPVVTHVAYSASGQCLATCESRATASGESEAALKFWDVTSGVVKGGVVSPMTLNTRVDEPHRAGTTHLAFHPQLDFAVTTGWDQKLLLPKGLDSRSHRDQGPGWLRMDTQTPLWEVPQTGTELQGPGTDGGLASDVHSSTHNVSDWGWGYGEKGQGAEVKGGGEFKVWERMSKAGAGSGAAGGATKGKGGTHSFWRCRSRGAYKGMAMHTAAFSNDGSALAVGAGSSVTLWDPHSLVLATVLTPSPTVAQLWTAQPARSHMQRRQHGYEAQGVSERMEAGSVGCVVRLGFCSMTPYLVATYSSAVVVWDLLTSSVVWALPLFTTSLTMDPVSSCFALAVPPPSHAGYHPGSSTGSGRRENGVPPPLISQTTQASQQGQEAAQQKEGAQEQQQQQQQQQVPRPRRGGAKEGETSLPEGGVVEESQRAAKSRGKGFPVNSQPSKSATTSQQENGANEGLVGAAGDTGDAAMHEKKVAPNSAQGRQSSQDQSGVQESSFSLVRQWMSCCHVLIFSPTSPHPHFSAPVPHATHLSLHFTCPGMPYHSVHSHVISSSGSGGVGMQGEQGVGGRSVQLSSLLVLREDRSYAFIGGLGRADWAKSSKGAKVTAQGEKEPQVSSLEAAFGSREALRAGKAALDVPMSQSGMPSIMWQQLFDAPSHVLPGPNALAASFLQLVCGDQG